MTKETQLQQVIQRYFSNEERQIELSPGDVLLRQGQVNQRLYLVLSGSLTAHYQLDSGDGLSAKVFSAQAGAFLGVHSFFSGTDEASLTIVAEQESRLAWIDKKTPVLDAELNGPLSQQFMPVILKELQRRQTRASEEALAKEAALTQLHAAEQMTTLGQLAAGLAHELNNAIGVVSAKTENIESEVITLLEQINPEASQFFDTGLINGQSVSSSEARLRRSVLIDRFGCEKHLAKGLAKAIPADENCQAWLDDPQQALRFWSLGRDLHDLRLASKHTVGIVRSVKQLGRSEVSPAESLDINDTLNKSMTLIKGELRHVEVRFRQSEVPNFLGSMTEWVQVWTNLLKNACDAVSGTENPLIEIQSRVDNNRIHVMISNNGPEIPEAIRRQIFQPNFTTKKTGLNFGLGLGLSIVKRIVLTYGGSIAVKSTKEKTIFRIKLPLDTLQEAQEQDGLHANA